MINRIFYSCLLLLLTLNIQAQQELGLHFADKIWQANKTNPGKMGQNGLVISLPSVYGNFYNSGFTYNDILKDIPGTDSVRLNLDEVISNLDEDNIFNTQANIDWLSVGFRTPKFQLGVSFSMKSSFYANYPKELLDLFWNGNAGYVNQTAEVATDFQAYSYSELAVGGAYQITDQLSVGGRLKYLSGIVDFSSELNGNSVSVFTDEEFYQVTLDTDYRFNSSSFAIIDSTISQVNRNTRFDFNKFFGSNTGFGLDLGATYQFNDKLELAASINDLGFINWSSNINNYESKGSYTYEGITFDPLVDGDSLSFSAIGDTLLDIFDVEVAQTATGYKTNLASKFYLSAKYEVIENLTIGGLFYGESYRGLFMPGVAISAQKDFGNILSVGGIYSYRNKSFTNLGVNVSAKLGPVQVYVLTDNLFPIFKPYDSKNFNLRVGLNLVFGKVGKGNKTQIELPLEND